MLKHVACYNTAYQLFQPMTDNYVQPGYYRLVSVWKSSENDKWPGATGTIERTQQSKQVHSCGHTEPWCTSARAATRACFLLLWSLSSGGNNFFLKPCIAGSLLTQSKKGERWLWHHCQLHCLELGCQGDITEVAVPSHIDDIAKCSTQRFIMHVLLG